MTSIFAPQHHNPLRGASDLQRSLYKKFEKALNTTLDSFNKQISHAIGKIESKLAACERNIKTIVVKARSSFDSELSVAETLVNKELRSKIIMSQWTNKFLSSVDQADLDPITFALSRYCLNICLCFQDVSPDYLNETNTHRHLVHYLSLPNQLVVGPALMALVHVSLYPEMKKHIVAAGALPQLLKIMVHTKSKPILAQCTKLIASLAMEPHNKVLIASTGCLHALYDLVLGNHVDVDEYIQYYTLCALINSIHRSDANRLLSVELLGVKPLLTLLQSTSHHQLIIHAVHVLANISFNNALTANNALIAGAGEVMLSILESVDVTGYDPHKSPDVALNNESGSIIAHAILSTLSNMCNSETNQTHIGNLTGVLEAALRICQYAQAVYLVTESANFLLATCFNNIINKTRIASKNGCRILSQRIAQVAARGGRDETICAERLCLALSSVLLYKTTHEAMFVSGGLPLLVELCKVVSDPGLLQSIGKVLVPLIPPADELLRVHQDNSRAAVERADVLPVLKKIKFKGFADAAVAPDWLEGALSILAMSDHDLATVPRQTTGLQEFVGLLFFCKEFHSNIAPDSTVQATRDFKGLLFSIY